MGFETRINGLTYNLSGKRHDAYSDDQYSDANQWARFRIFMGKFPFLLQSTIVGALKIHLGFRP